MVEKERTSGAATDFLGQFPPARTPAPGFPFKVIAKVGEGSMGTVYKALEPELERVVAIKVLRGEVLGSLGSDGQAREAHLRFLQEARSAAAIRHPGAVTIHRVGEAAGVPYIVMEWLEGETLAQRLAREGALPIAVAADVAWQVLETLQAAHEVGVIHRDIKPANLILLANGRVKVADFGIAQFRTANLVATQAGMLLGTPHYAAPEQLRCETVDPRCDLWAVAVTLYEMLTGERPFSGTNFREYVTQVLNVPPKRPSAWRPEISPTLEAVVMKGLARDRADRWTSANAMATALRAAQAPPTPPADPFPIGAIDRLSTVRVARQASYPVVRAAQGTMAHAITSYIRSWSSRELPQQNVEALLRKLLERPLHTEPYAGAVEVADQLLLVHDGVVAGALAVSARGATATRAPALGGVAPSRLYARPAAQPPVLVPFLAALAHGATRIESLLDATIVPPSALAARLAETRFSGGVALQTRDSRAVVVLADGQPLVAVAVGPWDGVPVESTWSSWAAAAPVTLHLEAFEPPILPLTYAMRLRDTELLCHRTHTGATTLSASSPTTRRLRSLARRVDEERASITIEPSRPSEVDVALLATDPAARLLHWLVEKAPAKLDSSVLRTRWKYLAEWIPLVSAARLHHHPDRTDAGLAALFDVVTMANDGKILHLVACREELNAQAFEAILADALEVKRARLATGDVGALIVVAPRFSDEVIEAYLHAIEETSRGISRLQENLTGYAGFVRLGRGRGFHVLLVEARDGTYEAMLE